MLESASIMDRIQAALNTSGMMRSSRTGPFFEYYTCFHVATEPATPEKKYCINTLFDDQYALKKFDRVGVEEVKLYDWDIFGIPKKPAEGPYYVRSRLWVIELPR